MNLFRDSLGGRMPLAGVRPFPWFRRRDARYGGRRGFQLPQTSIHRILEINPRGEAALKPLPLKPVCSILQPTLQYPKGEKSPSDKPTYRYLFGRAGISGSSQGFRVPTAQSSIFGSGAVRFPQSTEFRRIEKLFGLIRHMQGHLAQYA